MSSRKPLEPVRVVREHAVDRAAEALRAAVDAAAKARALADEARERVERLRAEGAERERAERAAARSAGDYAQLEAFKLGVAAKVAEADAHARKLEKNATDAASQVDASRRALTDARAALDVVEKHQARAREAADRELQERIDEAAEEGFAARHAKRS